EVHGPGEGEAERPCSMYHLRVPRSQAPTAERQAGAAAGRHAIPPAPTQQAEPADRHSRPADERQSSHAKKALRHQLLALRYDLSAFWKNFRLRYITATVATTMPPTQRQSRVRTITSAGTFDTSRIGRTNV